MDRLRTSSHDCLSDVVLVNSIGLLLARLSTGRRQCQTSYAPKVPQSTAYEVDSFTIISYKRASIAALRKNRF